MRFFSEKIVAWVAALTLLGTGACVAPHSITTSGKVTPQGEFRVAYNQGFNNLFLALGTIVGIVVVAAGHTAVGAALVLFGTASMALAGIVLVSTGRERIRAAALQFVPAALAVVLTSIGLATR